MTIYYTQQDFYSNGNQKITAFKPVSALCASFRHNTPCYVLTGTLHRASA